ncbi:hypothetical protein A374_18154 [Fictibacillus macauensis ZFHKF-1]|uniref:Membrane-spanning protein n=1 Tax=Fictibacillus macauensis ZFHKF-1 TaxID=1196324 RepID=I8AF68_9BACL|nr:hypothetical protein [Fictibacillus macauensis]EIT83984.1 hypothetical protein A374_18154 [Fictibacillus macauensis ZFHKF-1]
MKRNLLLWLSGLYSFTMLCLFIYYIALGQTSHWTVALGGAIVSALPLLFLKADHLPFSSFLIVGYYILLLSTIGLGTLARWYYHYSWWDTSLHVYGGFFTVFLAAALYDWLLQGTAQAKRMRWVRRSYVLAISVAITVIWEVYEFLGDLTITHTMQRGGNKDTMEDVIAGVCGALVALCFEWRARRN